MFHGEQQVPIDTPFIKLDSLLQLSGLGMPGGEANIRIADDKDTRADFRSIKKEITSSGAVRFDAERTEAIGHGDRFWGAALGFYAGAKPSESYFVPITRRSDRRLF